MRFAVGLSVTGVAANECETDTTFRLIACGRDHDPVLLASRPPLTLYSAPAATRHPAYGGVIFPSFFARRTAESFRFPFNCPPHKREFSGRPVAILQRPRPCA